LLNQLAEAHHPVTTDGVARAVAYAYQSYDHGRIPDADADVTDIFAK